MAIATEATSSWPIATLASGIGGGSGEKVSVAVCTAYFTADVAGDSPAALTVAGCVASKARWRGLEERWPRELRREGLTAFDARAFREGTGEFALGWSGDEPRRRRLIHALTRLVDQHVYRAFACSIRLDEYVAANADRAFAELGIHPYALCAGHLVGQVRLWMALRHPTDLTLFIFEDGDIDHREIRRVASAGGHGQTEPPQVWPRAWTDELGRRRHLRPVEACDVLTPDVSSLVGYFLTPSFYEHEWLTYESLLDLGRILRGGQRDCG